MYEYFGVGSQIREEVDDIYPRFLRWLPKHRLPMPSRHSLEIWHMVIDNLIIDDVSLFAFFVFFFLLLCMCVYGVFGVWIWFGLFLILRPFVIFQMTLNPSVRCEEYDECE